ncbi:MAG: MerR family transcriptional regulator [Myxococcota bacterium]
MSRLTGIPADTIRIWERRYGAVVPHRTEGNTRRYSVEQVGRLKLLRRLSQQGHSIGAIAALKTDELINLEGGSIADPPPAESDEVIDRYLDLIRAFEVRKANQYLSKIASLTPSVRLAVDFIGPLLQRVGNEWAEGELEIAHEHLATSQVRNLLGTLISQMDPPPGTPKLLATTPPDHAHEFGVLIGSFLAAARGLEPVYLGPSLPWNEIEKAVQTSGARIALLSVVRDVGKRELQNLSEGIRNLHSLVEVWVGVPKNHRLAEPNRIPGRVFTTFEDLDFALRSLRRS